MRFLPTPERPDEAAAPDRPLWRWVLYLSAASAVLCSTLPWVRVQFERLFGNHAGPPGWQSSAGFTCLCSCLLVSVMALVETDTASSRRAVRPGSLLLVAVTALALALEWWTGPGWVRGVTARWTAWFYLLSVSVPVLLAVCALRWAAVGPSASRRAARGHSSSGPPT